MYAERNESQRTSSTVTDEMVERAAFELYAAGPWGPSFVDPPHSMATYRLMARLVLKAALNEGNA